MTEDHTDCTCSPVWITHDQTDLDITTICLYQSPKLNQQPKVYKKKKGGKNTKWFSYKSQTKKLVGSHGDHLPLPMY